MSQLAVVTVTHNAADHVQGLLASIRGGMTGGRPEITAVDNGSSDETVRLLREDGDVRVIEQGNTGFAHGVNQGIAATSPGHDVLVLNPDVVLEMDAIERMRGVLAEVPRAAVVVPTLTDDGGSVLPSLRRDPSAARTLVEALVGGTRAGRFGESYSPEPDSRLLPVDWATGAVMLLRRSVVDLLGGLDESFFLYSEETEYCQRVRAAGHTVVCEPTARAMHVGGQLHEHPMLWTLRAVNRVRRQRRRSAPIAALAFQAASCAFELRRAMTGKPASRLAFQALLSRDLDSVAVALIRQLGGDPTPVLLRTAPSPSH